MSASSKRQCMTQRGSAPVAEPLVELTRADSVRIFRACKIAPRNDTGSCAMPSQQRSWQFQDGYNIWRAPGVWWHISPTSLKREFPVMVDGWLNITDSIVTFRCEGRGSRLFLASGCGLDLRLASFPPLSVAATRFDHYDIVLHALASNSFYIYVARSYSDAFQSWAEGVTLRLASAFARTLAPKTL